MKTSYIVRRWYKVKAKHLYKYHHNKIFANDEIFGSPVMSTTVGRKEGAILWPQNPCPDILTAITVTVEQIVKIKISDKGITAAHNILYVRKK